MLQGFKLYDSAIRGWHLADLQRQGRVASGQADRPISQPLRPGRTPITRRAREKGDATYSQWV